jgi:hypothetical protein
MTEQAYKPLNEAERDLYRFVLARRSADGGVRNAPVEAARAVLRARLECIRTGEADHVDVPLEVSAAMARDAMGHGPPWKCAAEGCAIETKHRHIVHADSTVTVEYSP